MFDKTSAIGVIDSGIGGFSVARKVQKLLPNENILYLGDTATDMLCAVHAGMVPIGALWGFRTEDELQKSGALRCLAHPSELLDALRLQM